MNTNTDGVSAMSTELNTRYLAIELAARRVATTWDSLGSVAHPVQASLKQQRLKRELDDLKNLLFNSKLGDNPVA